MDPQQIAALLIVGVAAFLLIRRKLRRKRQLFTQEGPCGCPGASSCGPPPPSILFRASKDGKRQVIMRAR